MKKALFLSLVTLLAVMPHAQNWFVAGVEGMDKLAEGGQFGTKDGHIGRDFRVGT